MSVVLLRLFSSECFHSHFRFDIISPVAGLSPAGRSCDAAAGFTGSYTNDSYIVLTCLCRTVWCGSCIRDSRKDEAVTTRTVTSTLASAVSF